MDNEVSLTNHFLIAMPGLEDPNFSRTVTYLCEHNSDGAMGLVINRPTEIELGEVLEHMEISAPDSPDLHLPVHEGGPVQPERGFVLHHPIGEWESTMRITSDIGVTTSRDILISIAGGKGPQDMLIALGYAGWAPGQLEEELAQNTWLNGPANTDILFRTPYNKRWDAAARLLGVDLGTLSSDIGHA